MDDYSISSADVVTEAIRSRHEIDNLIHQPSSSKNMSYNDSSSFNQNNNNNNHNHNHNHKKFIAPVDDGVATLSLKEFSNAIFQYEYLADLHATVADSIPEDMDGKKPDECLIDLGSVAYPAVFPQCPNLSQIQSSMSSQKLFITLYSIDGYNYTAEYNHVYRGKISWDTAYKDIFTIALRAIQTQDPSLSTDQAMSYTIYMLRMIAWETSLCQHAASDSIENTFPVLNAVAETTSFHHVKVYIGRHYGTTARIAGELCFWLRLSPGVEMTADRGPNDTLSITVARSFNFVYYRRYALNPIQVEEFSHNNRDPSVNGGDIIKHVNPNDPPLPPPPPPPPQDVQLWLLLGDLDIGTGGVDERIRRRNETVDEDHDDRRQQQQRPMPMYSGSDDVSVISTVRSSITGHNTQGQRTDISSLTGKKNNYKKDEAKAEDIAFQLLEGSSICSEILGWGQNITHALGLEKTDIYEPRPVPIPASLTLERVAQIACSPRHTLIVTKFGNIYGVGENSEGALGLGDTISRKQFTLIQWPQLEAPRITKVAAGSGDIGSHSLAIDENGALYSWGVAYSCGHGDVKPVLAPTLVTSFPIPKPGDEEDILSIDVDDDDDGNTPNITKVSVPVRDVAAGSGFSVIITKSGRVATFGMWAHGRLGQGPTPYRETRGKRKLARYQLRPRYLDIGGDWNDNGAYIVNKAIQVAAGDSHTLCLLENGSVLSWGHNSCGQIGSGVSASGFLRDCLIPAIVSPFNSNSSSSSSSSSSGNSNSGESNTNNSKTINTQTTSIDPSSGVRVESIACGAHHSICIDDRGCVWTWGARGADCLGHYDCQIEGDWAARIGGVFAAGTNSPKVMVPFELLDWCSKWSKPRRVMSLGERIVSATAGDMHSVFLTSDGVMYICGAGPVVPSFVPGGDTGTGAMTENENDNEEVEIVPPLAVAVPRCPTSIWLTPLSTRKTVLVSSGGTRCFALVDSETIVGATKMMLKRAIYGSSKNDGYGYDSDSDGESLKNKNTEAGSVDSHLYSDYNANTETSVALKKRGRVDCFVLASGKAMLTHKALLSIRSDELRTMIIEESPSIDSTGLEPTQILLPELNGDVARSLVHYLYTDLLPTYATASLNILRSLVRTGKKLRMPRLEMLAARVLHALHVAEKDAENGNYADDEASASTLDARSTSSSYRSIHGFGLELPPPPLARDLGSLVGDPQHADVRFFAEGKSIYAHRFVLEARCGYFRALFRSGMQDAEVDEAGKLDVIVPDSFVGFLRFVIFLYTNTLPDGSDLALLEDLLVADRYGATDMTRLCESMLGPTPTNWIDLLRAAHLVRSNRLIVEVEGWLRDNLHELRAPDADDVNGGDNGIGGSGREEMPSIFEEDDGEDFEENEAKNHHDFEDASAISGVTGFTQETNYKVKGKTTGGLSVQTGSHSTGTMNTRETMEALSTYSARMVENNPVLQTIKEEFPDLLPDLMAQRAAAKPLPPSEALIQRTLNKVADDGEALPGDSLNKDLGLAKGMTFPWKLMIIIVIGWFLHHILRSVRSFHFLLPLLNISVLVLLMYFAFVDQGQEDSTSKAAVLQMASAAGFRTPGNQAVRMVNSHPMTQSQQIAQNEARQRNYNRR